MTHIYWLKFIGESVDNLIKGPWVVLRHGVIMNCQPWLVLLLSRHSKTIERLHNVPFYLILIVQVIDNILEGITVTDVIARIPMEDVVVTLVEMIRPRLGSISGKMNTLLPYQVPEHGFQRIKERLIVVLLCSEFS